MSEPTRADLRYWTGEFASGNDPIIASVSDEQFDRIAREQGYVRDSFARQVAHQTADKMALDWIDSALSPRARAKALRLLLTVPCETCGGDSLLCVGEPHDHDDGCRCPANCVEGRVLRDGVYTFLTGESFARLEAMQDVIVFPASMLEVAGAGDE